MTTLPETTRPAELEDVTTGATGVFVSRLVETTTGQAPASVLLIGGLALSGLLSGTGTTAPIAEPQVHYIGGWTSTARTVGPGPSDRPTPRLASPLAVDASGPLGPAGAAGAASDRATQAAEVKWLHEQSGLTWEQLGRIFGVSRRAVHLWANGGRMNATNAQALAQLVALVRELPGRSANERRAALLAPTSEGASTVDQ